MAAAFALGAEGVQMGTRMVSSKESPIHDNWKQAIVDADETDTVMLRGEQGPAMRALRTDRTNRLEKEPPEVLFGEMKDAMSLYFGGDLEAAIALTGQVAGRIDSIESAADVVRETMEEFKKVVSGMAAQYTA